MRLRAYDKLQKLVFSGAVKKDGKVYTGNSAALAAMSENAPHAATIRSNPTCAFLRSDLDFMRLGGRVQ